MTNGNNHMNSRMLSLILLDLKHLESGLRTQLLIVTLFSLQCNILLAYELYPMSSFVCSLFKRFCAFSKLHFVVFVHLVFCPLCDNSRIGPTVLLYSSSGLGSVCRATDMNNSL